MFIEEIHNLDILQTIRFKHATTRYKLKRYAIYKQPLFYLLIITIVFIIQNKTSNAIKFVTRYTKIIVNMFETSD